MPPQENHDASLGRLWCPTEKLLLRKEGGFGWQNLDEGNGHGRKIGVPQHLGVQHVLLGLFSSVSRWFRRYIDWHMA